MRRRTLALSLAAAALVVGAVPAHATTLTIPTVLPSRGSATAWYSGGGPGSPSPGATLELRGTISFALKSYVGSARMVLALEGTATLYAGYWDGPALATCHEVDTVMLEPQGPAQATLVCVGRVGSTGPKGVTVLHVALPTWTPDPVTRVDDRYDGVFVG